MNFYVGPVVNITRHQIKVDGKKKAGLTRLTFAENIDPDYQWGMVLPTSLNKPTWQKVICERSMHDLFDKKDAIVFNKINSDKILNDWIIANNEMLKAANEYFGEENIDVQLEALRYF